MADPLRSSAAGLLLPRYAAVPEGVHPAQLSPPYRSTVGRAPSQPLVALPQRLTEVTGVRCSGTGASPSATPT